MIGTDGFPKIIFLIDSLKLKIENWWFEEDLRLYIQQYEMVNCVLKMGIHITGRPSSSALSLVSFLVSAAISGRSTGWITTTASTRISTAATATMVRNCLSRSGEVRLSMERILIYYWVMLWFLLRNVDCYNQNRHDWWYNYRNVCRSDIRTCCYCDDLDAGL